MRKTQDILKENLNKRLKINYLLLKYNLNTFKDYLNSKAICLMKYKIYKILNSNNVLQKDIY